MTDGNLIQLKIEEIEVKWRAAREMLRAHMLGGMDDESAEAAAEFEEKTKVLFLILYGKKTNSGHYGLFRISFEHKQMTYYDSLGWKNPELYNKMWELLNLESLDKLQSPFNYDGWRRMEPVDLPKQAAGSNDCGIFAMLFARDIAREGIISFNSSEALLARHQFAYEMLLYEPVATAKPKQQYPIKVKQDLENNGKEINVWRRNTTRAVE
jgi:hypothetical protein